MAEAVGIAASVATLSKIIQCSAVAIYRIRGAPKEIVDLSQELAQLSIELEILYELQNTSSIPDNFATKQIWATQQTSLSMVQTRVLTVQSELELWETRSKGIGGKVKWLIVGREETSRLLQNLLQIRMALTSAMTMSSRLLQVAFHAEEIRAIHELGVSQRNLLQNRGDDVLSSPASPEQYTLFGSRELFQDCSNAEASFDLPLIGRMASTINTLRHHSGIITYAISLLLQLPFSRVLVADIFLRCWSSSWLNFRILRNSTLAVMKLVEEDSVFITACRQADTHTMKKMLEQHKASPNEITSENRTPLWEAVESGNVQAVELLLHYGADVNSLFGRKQMSPLVASIRRRDAGMVRFLLAHGACDQHVTALGWTPLFYLWSRSSSRLREKPADSMLAILSSRPSFALSHSDIVDTRDYGLIHMAAIRGTAADIHALVKRGVDPFMKTGPRQWQAIHFAIENGNLDTFEALLSNYPTDGVHNLDAQGWTLLHISAITGHEHITQRLLELGVDQHALTTAKLMSVPDGLEHLEPEIRGSRWSALQLAGLHSTHRQAIYLRAVSKAWETVEISGIDQDNEEWTDATMYIE